MGRPLVDSEAVNVRLQRQDLDGIDTWIERQPDPKPSRPEAIRVGVRAWLSGLGLLMAPGSDLDMAIEKLDQEHAAMGAKPSPKKALNRMRAAIAKNKKGQLGNESILATPVQDRSFARATKAVAGASDS